MAAESTAMRSATSPPDGGAPTAVGDAVEGGALSARGVAPPARLAPRPPPAPEAVWTTWPGLALTPYVPYKELGRGAFGSVVVSKKGPAKKNRVLRRLQSRAAASALYPRASPPPLQAAVHRETGAKVALKRVPSLAATRSDGLQELRELRILRALGAHPQCLRLYDVVCVSPAASDASATGELFIITQLLDSDLHRVIQSPQVLGEAHLKHLMFQLLRGLRYAHSMGIVHRDIKPANL